MTYGCASWLGMCIDTIAICYVCVHLDKCKLTLPFECEVKWQEGRKYGLPYGHVFVQWSGVIQSKIQRIEVDFEGYIYRETR